MQIFLRPASCLIALLISASAFAAQAEGTLKPETPHCEYLTNPVGTDVVQPRLMWTLAAVDPKARSLRETACQVLVASTPEKLTQNEGDLWDGGKTTRGDVLMIDYAGTTTSKPPRHHEIRPCRNSSLPCVVKRHKRKNL